jgi:hypothetical protein
MSKQRHIHQKLDKGPIKVIIFSGEDDIFQNSIVFLKLELITLKTNYVSVKSTKPIKSYSLFRKTIFSKSPKNAPLQFRNRSGHVGIPIVFLKSITVRADDLGQISTLTLDCGPMESCIILLLVLFF